MDAIRAGSEKAKNLGQLPGGDDAAAVARVFGMSNTVDGFVDSLNTIHDEIVDFLVMFKDLSPLKAVEAAVGAGGGLTTPSDQEVGDREFEKVCWTQGVKLIDL